jgi:hypothetical protein
MSVLGITAIHGVAVLFVGLKTGSRAWLVLAALASAAVGAVTGSPMYLGMDLLGVCLGLAAGWVCIRPKKPAAPAPNPAPVPLVTPRPAIVCTTAPRRRPGLIRMLLVAALAGIAGAWVQRSMGTDPPAPESPRTEVSTPRSYASGSAASAAVPVAHPERQAPALSEPSSEPRATSDLRHCLGLRSNAEIANCSLRAR